MKKSTWIIFLSVATQLEWVTSAPLETISKQAIVSLSEGIIAVVNDGTIEIVKKNEEIEFMIGTAEDSIKNSLEELVQFIKETKVKANEEDVDISSCLDQTIVIDEIDENEIRKCSNEEELYDLKNQLLDVGNRSAVLVGLVEDVSSDNSEFDSIINDIESDLSNLQTKIEEVLSKAFLTAMHCTQAHLALLDHQITLISSEFASCLDGFQEF